MCPLDPNFELQYNRRLIVENAKYALRIDAEVRGLTVVGWLESVDQLPRPIIAAESRIPKIKRKGRENVLRLPPPEER